MGAETGVAAQLLEALLRRLVRLPLHYAAEAPKSLAVLKLHGYQLETSLMRAYEADDCLHTDRTKPAGNFQRRLCSHRELQVTC